MASVHETWTERRENMDNEKIAKKLFDLRKSRGETIVEVADAVGVTQSAMSMYECGKRIPRDEVKMALARHYNTSIESIFFS